jgi:hypothetical protein
MRKPQLGMIAVASPKTVTSPRRPFARSKDIAEVRASSEAKRLCQNLEGDETLEIAPADRQT